MRTWVRLSFVAVAAALLGGLLTAPVGAQQPVRNRTMEMPEHFGLVDPATGVWHLEGMGAFYYGDPGDEPFMGDWDCDSVDTPGLYRRSDGFVYLRNSNTEGVADLSFYFGDPGDLPLAGDFDGDGCDSVSLYRPSESKVYVINRLGSADRGLGAAEAVFRFGNAGDQPFAGDFDGDGVDEIGVYRASTGLVYLGRDLAEGRAGMVFRAGKPGDRFVAGDWNGMWGCDGSEMECDLEQIVDTIAMFHPGERRFYMRYHNTSGPAIEGPRWGEPDWLPVSGRFVRHPADVLRDAMVGTWHGTGSITSVPVPPPPWDVKIVFSADGTYSVQGLLPPHMLFGPEVDSPDRTFDVFGVEPDGSGWGVLLAVVPGDPDAAMWLEDITVLDTSMSFRGHRGSTAFVYQFTRVG